MASTFTLSANCYSVSIVGNIVYGTEFKRIRLNQFEIPTADGSDVVYDAGPTQVRGIVIIKNVSNADGLSLRDFIKTRLIFSLNTMTISAIPGVDLGNGVNTAISSARFDNRNTDEGVFELKPPGLFDVKFPYRYILS